MQNRWASGPLSTTAIIPRRHASGWTTGGGGGSPVEDGSLPGGGGAWIGAVSIGGACDEPLASTAGPPSAAPGPCPGEQRHEGASAEATRTAARRGSADMT